MKMKLNLVFAAAMMLVVAPLAVSAKPEAKNNGKDKDIGVFGAEFGANERRDGDKGKAGAKEADKGKAGPKEADKPGIKPGVKPGAKEDKVVFDPPPPVPDETVVAKAKKAKKPYYMKFAEAKEMAWKCQQPLIVAMLPMGDARATYLEAKVLKDKLFAKDFALQNCVMLLWHVKPGKIEMPPPEQRRRNGPPPRATTIDERPLKQPEKKFLTAFAVKPELKANAQRNNQDPPKFTDMRNYPEVFVVDASCTKLLFRAPLLEQDKGRAGFGAYISQMVDLFRGATQGDPVVSPALQKVVDNPTEPKKWK